MNKIFKVVWSKTKECYVVVSEVAKNNGGKKKVLASVLAGLAMVGAGAQVQAYSGLGGHDNPAVETLAVGPDTWANQEAAVAVGMHNNANGQPAGKHSVAIGSFSNANGEISIAMGGVTNASGKMSVAVGYRASATDEAAVALGNMVSADKNSTGVGPGATASGTYAFAGGYQSETTGISGVAIGDNAKAKAARAMAIGGHAEATAEQAIAIGSDTGAGNKTTASKKNAIAVGHGATASGLDTAAIGTSATASGQSSVALGNGTQSTNLNTTAIGSNVQSTKTGSIGIGGNVESIGDYSVAIGSASAGKTVKAVDYATAVGGLSNAAERAAALGAGANAAQARSVAIGYKATASTADGVAIGSTSVASTAAGVQGFNPADSRTNKYGGLTSAAQTSTLAAVSIGNGSAQTRQITGLAAGKEDTDAVNVAQLRSVNLKYAADTGNSDFLLTDGTLTVNGDGDLISTSVESTGAIKVTAKKGGNITHTDGKAVKPTTNGIATTDNVVDAINDSYWKATAGGNTDGTPSVGNVKPGTQVTYSAGDNLKVKQTIAANGNQEYKYSLNPVLTGITSIANTTTGPKMTFGGNSINITGGSLDMGNNKITNLATGTDDKDAVNVKQLKDTEIHITPGTYTPDSNKKVTLTYENGDNKTVAGKTAVIDLSGLATGGTASTESVVKKAAATGDTNIADVSVAGGKAVNDPGAQYEVSVSKNAVKDAAREAVTVNNGGNTDNPISVTPTQDNTNHNTTYAVTFDGNKAAKQIPLTYKATNGTTTTADQTVKLDKGLNFTGGDYTTASVGADGKVTFDVNLGTAPT
ncbi:MAG: ESPR-type extended signal peptide-containing protein, partial [Veillonella sp.]|uniref:ESPR-type extended signal peptide-containing protein n=1 Tax=Veillonella sp. TaxID=1926307 RepID=UPI0029029682